MSTPNWQHNSGKDKKGKGACKGRLRASKEALRALKRKYKGGSNSSPSYVLTNC